MQLVAVKNKFQVVIPYKLRASVRVKVGDFMEAKVVKGSVVLTPKKIVDDYSDMPNADDEYTPAQRKVLDAKLAEAVAEYRAGKSYGPFDTHKGMMDFLNKETKKLKTKNLT